MIDERQNKSAHGSEREDGGTWHAALFNRVQGNAARAVAGTLRAWHTYLISIALEVAKVVTSDELDDQTLEDLVLVVRRALVPVGARHGDEFADHLVRLLQEWEEFAASARQPDLLVRLLGLLLPLGGRHGDGGQLCGEDELYLGVLVFYFGNAVNSANNEGCCLEIIDPM